MKEKIQYPSSLERAIEYVNQRWVFDEQKYPAMSQLDEEKRFIFILKHIFLHIVKYPDTRALSNDFAKKVSFVDFSADGEKHFFKLFIGCAQYVHFLNIPISEIIAQSKPDIATEYALFLQNIARTLEKGDHQGVLEEQDTKDLQEATKRFLSHLLSFEPSQIPWEYLGQYLK